VQMHGSAENWEIRPHLGPAVPDLSISACRLPISTRRLPVSTRRRRWAVSDESGTALLWI